MPRMVARTAPESGDDLVGLEMVAREGCLGLADVFLEEGVGDVAIEQRLGLGLGGEGVEVLLDDLLAGVQDGCGHAGSPEAVGGIGRVVDARGPQHPSLEAERGAGAGGGKQSSKRVRVGQW